MVRPKKKRIIQKEPLIAQFSPRGRPGRPDRADLNLDHYEAIRLTDFIGLDQEAASKSMGVSQQTFSRILKAGRKRLADGLILGKIINIKGPKKPSEKGKSP